MLSGNFYMSAMKFLYTMIFKEQFVLVRLSTPIVHFRTCCLASVHGRARAFVGELLAVAIIDLFLEESIVIVYGNI